MSGENRERRRTGLRQRIALAAADGDWVQPVVDERVYDGGGPADQTVIDGVVQEIDVRTGKVLFEWNSADRVPYSQSEQPLPASASTPWDWFHINAVHLDSDGNLLIDARDTWTTYKVNRHKR